MPVQPPEIAQESSHGSQHEFRLLEDAVPRAPGLGYSWRLQELHSPVPGLAGRGGVHAWAGPRDGVR